MQGEDFYTKTHPGIGALREIRFYQKSTCFLIPMRAFQRLVRQVALDEALNGKEYHWQAQALFALQQAAEAYMVAYLCDTNLLAIHAKRSMIMDKDMMLVKECEGGVPLDLRWETTNLRMNSSL